MSSLPVRPARAASAASFVLLLLAACSSDSSTKTPGPAKTDSGSSTPATFTNGVLPILSDSCALTACHSSGQSNLGIHLTYNADQVYTELQKESPTHPGL